MFTPIRTAITGGGTAGASLLHALLKHPRLCVRILESAAEFREAGAAVASRYLVRAGAVPQRGRRFMLAQREGWNSIIDETRDDDGWTLKGSVHRAAFLRELRI
ncbi:predicted protein [Histoplasma capsulatum G186AR]|uniref:Salicylate hydroxylase n=1 Tax=Ajellomyces capsulatus (strain G186AR / H82 / ATCC MYA-2454 / RMSCC 2432) TaxID=447093 RepID=C0NE52_AJECG|nr:uncharacterized protein HCBG_02145 [Histoplasma capsulatum G186AR]EEH10500.1 predicted protein [Histoplasma capsulatum G186AR]